MQDSAEFQDSLILHLQQRKHESKWNSETHPFLSQNIPRVSSYCV